MATTSITPFSILDLSSTPELTRTVLHENLEASAWDPSKLQAGLCYDSTGTLRIKPEIEAKLCPERRAIVEWLLAAHRAAEANSLLACQLLHKILELCPNGHEKYVAKVSCSKLFLCSYCATPKARMAKLRYDHPLLYHHLLSTRFTVLTLTIAIPRSRESFEEARRHFESLMTEIEAEGAYFLPAFERTSEQTKAFAIITGPRLPAWPKLNRMWKEIAGARGEIHAKLYDGRDSQEYDQKAGLYQAFSGFVEYHLSGQATAENSEQWVGFRSIIPWGNFRGFDKRAQEERFEDGHGTIPTEICEDGHEHGVPTCCSQCSATLVKGDAHLPLQTFEELSRDGATIYFGRSTKPTYARCGSWLYEERREPVESQHSPPS